MKALAVSEKHNLEKFVTLQAFYSLIAEDLENELVPLCIDQKLGILPWSPLGGGFLTGKYRRGEKRPENARDPTKKTSSLNLMRKKVLLLLMNWKRSQKTIMLHCTGSVKLSSKKTRSYIRYYRCEKQKSNWRIISILQNGK